MESNNNVADLTYLRRVTSNDLTLMRFFIKSYLKEAPSCIASLETAISEKNWTALKKAAHTFKPQVNYMGLTEIIPLVQEVEDIADGESGLDAVGEKVRRIVDVGRAAIDELQQKLDQLDKA